MLFLIAIPVVILIAQIISLVRQTSLDHKLDEDPQPSQLEPFQD